MRKKGYIFISCMIFFACNTQKDKSTTGDTDSASLVTAIDSANITTDSHSLWVAEFNDSTGKISMKKTRPLSADSLTPPYLISQLNMQYPNVLLEFTGIEGDTIFVKIRKSNFLTQQMGSTGADVYLTEVTYNLTELKNIEYVSFDFKEGDHAAPGTYSRTDFVNVLR